MISDPDDALTKAKYLIECAETVQDYRGELASLYYLLSSAYKMKNQMANAKNALKKVFECRELTNGKEAPRTLSSRREWMECPTE